MRIKCVHLTNIVIGPLADNEREMITRRLEIPKEAVAILGSGDNFQHGIEKFLVSFIPSFHWKERENTIKSVSCFEPIPYAGDWSATLYLLSIPIKFTGNFRVIPNVYF